MEFSRQEYWSGLPFPPPGNLSNPGIGSNPHLLRWQVDSLPLTKHIWWEAALFKKAEKIYENRIQYRALEGVHSSERGWSLSSINFPVSLLLTVMMPLLATVLLWRVIIILQMQIYENGWFRILGFTLENKVVLDAQRSGLLPFQPPYNFSASELHPTCSKFLHIILVSLLICLTFNFLIIIIINISRGTRHCFKQFFHWLLETFQMRKLKCWEKSALLTTTPECFK